MASYMPTALMRSSAAAAASSKPGSSASAPSHIRGSFTTAWMISRALPPRCRS